MVQVKASAGEDDPLLTTGEAARMLHVTPKTVVRWAKQGKLPAIRTLGGHRRYRRSVLNSAFAKADSEVENT